MTHALEITTLGGLEVRRGSEHVTAFESDKVRALLVYLAVEAERAHRRERLAGLLWPERPERAARSNLRHVLSQLRDTIGDRDATPPFLHITRHTIQLNPASDVSVDVQAFIDLLEPRSGETDTVRRLEQATALFKGAFLEGFSLPDCAQFEEWVLLTAELAERLVLDALEQLVASYEAAGAYESALPHARRHVALDPWAEKARRGLMRLLALSGQQAAALAEYEACRDFLEQELGVEPAPETTELFEQILNGELTRPGAVVDAPFHSLPQQPTPFVGRCPELADVTERMMDPACRLLTLVGPGGIGKTRLAIQAVAAVREDPSANTGFSDGFCFVSLAGVAGADELGSAIANGLNLNLRADVDPRQQLLSYLRSKRMLVVLDNLEHHLDEVDLITDALAEAPGLKVLTTSRAALNLQQEACYPVSGMRYPDANGRDGVGDVELDALGAFDALDLFVQSARRVRPSFSLTAESRAVIDICRLVEGMPLGIELAAAWTRALPCAEIVREIEASFDFLATSQRDVPARHRSLRATFEYSWHLLTEREREVFRALAVFRGGFARDAARFVAGATVWELLALVRKSLLRRDAGGRFDVHALLRQFGLEKLEESRDAATMAHNRHCAFFATAVAGWGQDLKGSRQTEAMAEMRADRQNVRAAWRWAASERSLRPLDQMLEGICWFYWRGTVRDGEALLSLAEEVFAAPDSSSTDAKALRFRARTLCRLGFFRRMMGRSQAAQEHVDEALALLDSPLLVDEDTRAERAYALRMIEAYEESAALYREIGDRHGLSFVLNSLATKAYNACDHLRARRLEQECLAIRRELGDRWGTASALAGAGMWSATFGELDEAERMIREAIQIHQDVGFVGFESGMVMWCLGRTLRWSGRFAEARALFREAMTRCEDAGVVDWAVLCQTLLAAALESEGAYAEARKHLNNALEFVHALRLRLQGSYVHLVLGTLSLADSERPDERRLYQSLAVNREYGCLGMTSEASCMLGYAARQRGDRPGAKAHLYSGLRDALDSRSFWSLVISVPAVALVLADEGQTERAVELYGLALRYPFVANSKWFEDVAGTHIAAVAATLPPDVVTAAQERGRARDLWETARELLEELSGPPV